MVRHSWRTHLKGAGTVDAVLGVVEQFLGEWKPDEVALLPKGSWPKALKSRKDVIDCSFRLGEMHADFSGNAASLARLQELLLFFTHVAVRITQVERSMIDGAANSSAFMETDPSGKAVAPVKRPPAKKKG